LRKVVQTAESLALGPVDVRTGAVIEKRRMPGAALVTPLSSINQQVERASWRRSRRSEDDGCRAKKLAVQIRGIAECRLGCYEGRKEQGPFEMSDGTDKEIAARPIN
jgi:hypothetical protein